MSETFLRGLRYIERIDDVVLVCLSASTAELTDCFPDRHALILSPNGRATVVLDAAAVPHDIGATDRLRMMRGYTLIRASGVCMSGAENKARLIGARLARAGIALHALSLCDLAVSFVVRTLDADRAFALVEEAVPLAW